MPLNKSKNVRNGTERHCESLVKRIKYWKTYQYLFIFEEMFITSSWLTPTFSILKSKVSTCLSFSCFSIIFGSFWRPWGLFWHPFGAFVVSFGVLVSSFWVPLARLGCLWALSATFCGAFGPSGLSLGLLSYFLVTRAARRGFFDLFSFILWQSLDHFWWFSVMFLSSV